MPRFLVVMIGLLLTALPAQAALITYDISGTARTGSGAFGIDAGDLLTGTLTLDDSVSHGESRTGDVAGFELRVGNTVFDMNGGNFEASYELRDDALFKLNIHAKPQEFHRDMRQLLLNLTPHDVTLKLKDLGNDWIHVDNIEIQRTSLVAQGTSFNSNLSTVAEPASALAFAAALGLLGVIGLRRRTV